MKAVRPIIGVMPLWDDDRSSIWMLPGYTDGLTDADALPLILPFVSSEEDAAALAEKCDGFLFTGGQDVAPELYGEEPLPELGETCPKRDVMEAAFLRLALRDDKPVLGICRGIQFINAALGGTLYQDLTSQHPSGIQHHQNAPYDVPSHAVCLTVGSPLARLLGKGRLMVNSYHHQAVKELAPGLSAMAVSDDSLIEAVCKPEARFLWAVQWHPEFSFPVDEDSRRIFSAFVEACRH